VRPSSRVPGRVLIVVGSLVRGGGERQALLAARALLASGIEVAVHVTQPPLLLLEDGVAEGLRLFIQPARRSLVQQVTALRDTIEEWCPDIIITFMTSASARLLLLRVVSSAAREAKWIASERGNIELRSLRRAPFGTLTRLASIRCADQIVVNAASLAGNVLSYAGDLAHKITIIQNVLEPFPLDAIAARARVVELVGRDVPFPSLVAIGSFQRARNYEGLARALSHVVQEFPSVHLTVCGRTAGPDCEPETRRFRRIVDELGLQRHVTVLGEVRNARALLPAFDAFVLASRLEGSSNGLAEALLAGTPVATTPVGDAPETVSGAGVVARGWTPAALGDAITAVLREHDRWRIEAAQRSPALRAARHHTVVARSWVSLIQEMGSGRVGLRPFAT
jgi:glycosyltransferase involved in cell wall biosynthesis